MKKAAVKLAPAQVAVQGMFAKADRDCAAWAKREGKLDPAKKASHRAAAHVRPFKDRYGQA